MTKVRTLMQWHEPEIPGQPLVWHEPGEVADVDPARVFDLDDLIRGGAVELVVAAALTGLSDLKTALNDAVAGAEAAAELAEHLNRVGAKASRRAKSEGEES